MSGFWVIGLSDKSQGKDGLSTKKIGEYVGLSSEDVTARLNQHQESDEVKASAKLEPEVDTNSQEEASRLVA